MISLSKMIHIISLKIIMTTTIIIKEITIVIIVITEIRNDSLYLIICKNMFLFVIPRGNKLK
jgi:hypothetical protein